jgi:hypothetical protein
MAEDVGVFISRRRRREDESGVRASERLRRGRCRHSSWSESRKGWKERSEPGDGMSLGGLLLRARPGCARSVPAQRGK